MRAALAYSLGTAAAIVVLAPAGPAAANYPDRESALSAYQQAIRDIGVDVGWTGSVDGCVVGTESAASLDATLRTVNTLRKFAGIGPVMFDAEKNRKALAAALMMHAANDLSHEPGPDWPCSSPAGVEGARNSSLSLGASGAEAMVGYVDDSGTADLGHRRWLLDPSENVFGSGSTGRANALYGFGDAPVPVAQDSVVAWPSPGWFPMPWVFEDWSAAIGIHDTPASITFDSPRVEVTIDGVPASVSGLRPIDPQFGPSQTLAWRVGLPAGTGNPQSKIQVKISGVLRDGKPMPIDYSIDAFTTSDVELAAPTLTLSGAKRQKLSKRVKLRSLCDIECTAVATGKLIVKASGKKMAFNLKRARRELGGGERAALNPKLARRALRAAKRAFRRGGNVKARVRVTATGANGKRTSERLRVRLRR